jgi:hypothetical protein
MLLLLTQIVFFQGMHVLFELSCKGIFGVNRAILHLEIHKLHKVFLDKLRQFPQGAIALDLLLLSQMVVFGEIHVFLQFSIIGHFVIK